MDHRYVLADVFTDRPLAGNQLAVFLAAELLDEALLLPVARELNLSETVFVYPPAGAGTARVRYFTTVQELDFAGHPTLGTAAVLAHERFDGRDPVDIVLETPKAEVPVTLRRNGSAFLGWMTQPTPTVRRWEHTAELLGVLRVPATQVPVEVYDNGIQHLYVTLEQPSDVLAVEPDFAALGRLCGPVRINVFAGAGSSYTSRMFSPFDLALKEDPACGSAAGPLALHLLRHGRIGAGQEITIAQGECVGRPSTLYARVTADIDDGGEVMVGGSTVIVGEGTLRL
jgi:trans-2,3-dihydro-3-hydroxyanthranilate isomerase